MAVWKGHKREPGLNEAKKRPMSNSGLRSRIWWLELGQLRKKMCVISDQRYKNERVLQVPLSSAPSVNLP